MTLSVELGVDELADTRFAISPLSETVSALQQLARHQRQAINLRWHQWAADQVRRMPPDLRLTSLLLASDRPKFPSFLVPAPRGPETTIDDDLLALRRTTSKQVRISLQRVFGDALPRPLMELERDPRAGLQQVAQELRAAYDLLIAPHWPRIRAVLHADIAYRTRQLASGGAARMFADLHPDLHWSAGRLVLRTRPSGDDSTVKRGPGGLVLMPLALGPPMVLMKKNTHTQTTVRYPARGVGTLWTAGTQAPAGSVVRLLGKTRAMLLEALRSPATTTDLARALGVTPSAVSQHLRVLRENGLVIRDRSGRDVLYASTDLAISLLGEH